RERRSGRIPAGPEPDRAEIPGASRSAAERQHRVPALRRPGRGEQQRPRLVRRLQQGQGRGAGVRRRNRSIGRKGETVMLEFLRKIFGSLQSTTVEFQNTI